MIWTGVNKFLTACLNDQKIAVEIPNMCIILATDQYKCYKDPLEKTYSRVSQTIASFEDTPTRLIAVFDDNFLKASHVQPKIEQLLKAPLRYSASDKQQINSAYKIVALDYK